MIAGKVEWHRPLTAEEMVDVIEQGDEDPALAIVALFTLAYDELGLVFSEQPSVEPWSVAIPEEQWLAICEALAAKWKIAGALMWMNKGPSSYKEGE